MRTILLLLVVLAQLSAAVSGTSTLQIVQPGSGVLLGPAYGGVWDGTQLLAPATTATGHHLRLVLVSTETVATTGLTATLTLPSGFHTLANTATVTNAGGAVAFSVTPASPLDGASGRTFTIPTMAAGDTLTLAIDVYASTPAVTLTNASLTWAWAAGGTALGTTSTVTQVQRGRLGFTLRAEQATLKPGDSGRFTATLNNTGSAGCFFIEVDPKQMRDDALRRALKFTGWDAATIPAGATIDPATQILRLPYLERATEATAQFTAVAEGCGDLSGQIDASDLWQRDQVAPQVSSAVVSVRIDSAEPKFVFAAGPPTLAIPYGAWQSATLTIANSGQGRATAVEIAANLPAVAEIRFPAPNTAGWTWDATHQRFILPATRVVAAAESIPLTFEARIPPASAAAAIASQVTWEVFSQNLCGDPYSLPVALANVTYPGVPQLTLTLTPERTIVQYGDTQTVAIRVQVSDKTKINAGGITVTMPAPTALLSFLSATGPGTFDAVGDGFAWTLTPAQLDSTGVATLALRVRFVGDPLACPGGQRAPITGSAAATSTPWPAETPVQTLALATTAATSLVTVTNADQTTDPAAFSFAVDGSPAATDGWRTGTASGTGVGETIPLRAVYPIAVADATWSAAGFTHVGVANGPLALVANSLQYTVTGRTGEGVISGTVPGASISLLTASSVTTGFAVDLTFIQTDITNAGWSDATHMSGRRLALSWQVIAQDRATTREIAQQMATLSLSGLAAGTCPSSPGVTQYVGFVDLPVVRGEANPAVVVPDLIDAGVPFTTTVTVTNPRGAPAKDITIDLAGGSLYEMVGTPAAGGGFTQVGSTTAFTAPTLAAGASATITVQLRLPLAATGTPEVRYTSRWNSEQESAAVTIPAASTTSAADAPVVVRRARLLPKVSPQILTIDRADLSWTLFVTNSGSGAAPLATITCDLPSEFITASMNVLAASIDGVDVLASTTVSGHPHLVITRPSSPVLAAGSTLTLQIAGTMSGTATAASISAKSQTIAATWGVLGGMDTPATTTQTYRVTEARVECNLAPSNSFTDPSAVQTPDLGSATAAYPVIRNTGQSVLTNGVLVFTLPASLPFNSAAGLKFKARRGSTIDTAFSSAGTDGLVIVGSQLTITGSTSATAGTLSRALAELVPQGLATGAGINAIQIELPYTVTEDAAVPANPVITATIDLLLPLAGDDSGGSATDKAADSLTVKPRQPQLAVRTTLANATVNAAAFADVALGGWDDHVLVKAAITNSGPIAASNLALRFSLPVGAAWSGPVTISGPGAPSGSLTPDGGGVYLVPLNVAQTIAAGATATWVIDVGTVQGTADVTWTVAASCGTDTTHFDVAALQAQDDALLRLAPQIDTTPGVLFTVVPAANARLTVDGTVSNLGGTCVDPQVVVDLTAAPFQHDAGLTATVITAPTGLTLAGVTQSGSTLTISWTGALRGGELATVRFALIPTRTDSAVDPTQIPEVAADPVGDISATVGGTITVKDSSPSHTVLPAQTFSGVVLNAATPDLDVTKVDPAAALVRDGQSLTITSTIVNNGETGSIAQVPVIEILELGTGWATPQVQVIRDGVAGTLVTAHVGQRITLTDLPRWAGGTAANPTSNVALLRFTGTASASAGGSLAWRFRVSNRIRSADGSDPGIGDLSRDEARAVILGFDVAKTVVSSSEAWSSDTAPRTVLVGEDVTDHIVATWFGGDASHPITAVSLFDRLAAGATGISATSSGAVSGTTVTWTQASFPGTGTLGGDVSARPNAAAATTLVADGRPFDDIADATFTYLGTVFTSSTPGFPAAAVRQITRTIREPAPTLTVQVATAAGGPFASSVPADGGDVRYVTVTFANAASRSPAYDATVTLPLPTGLTLSGSATASTGSVSGTSTLVWTLSPLDPNTSATLTFAVTVSPTVDLGNTLTLAATSTSDSLVANPSPNARTYTRTGSATIVANRESLTLAQTASTETSTAGTVLLIGERSDWRVTSVLPPGTAPALVYRLRIPRGMACDALPTPVRGSAISGGAVVWTVGGVAPTLPIIATSADVDLLGTFGAQVIVAGIPADRTLTLDGGLRFANLTTVGTTGSEIASGTLTAGSNTGASGVSERTATLAHTAIEPQVALVAAWRNVTAGDATSFATFTRPDAGDTLELRLTATASTATSSDLLLSTVLSNVTYASLVSATVAGVDRTGELAPQVTGSVGAQTLTVGRGVGGHNPITLAAGQTLVAIVRVTTAGTLLPETALAANSSLDWTSLTGSSTVERSGTGGAPNDYTTAANLAASSHVGPTITAVPGTKPLAAGWRAGETVTWTVTLDAIPEGTLPSSQVTLALPTGLTLTGVTVVPTTGVSATVALPTVPATGSAVVGLGTLVVAPDNAAGDRLVLNCTGYTSAALPQQALTSLNAAATAQWQRADTTTATANATAVLPIVQPVIAVTTKSVLSPAGQVEAGGVVSWRITARNSGQGPAYALSFTDTLPAAMNGLTVVSASIGGAALPVAVVGSTLTVTLPAAGWRGGETITIDVRATVAPATAAATSLVNAAGLLSAASLPAGHADLAHVRLYGPQSPLINAPAVIVDTIAPTAPVITGIADDSGDSAADGVTNDRLVLVSGTTRPVDGAVTVEVYLGGALIGTTPVAADGTWSFADPGPARADGTYAWTAKALDITSNRSPASPAYPMVVDTVAPTVDVTDLLTNNPRPTLNGVVTDAVPSSGVTHLQVIVAGRTYTLGDGFLTLSGSAWTLNLATLGAPLADGPYVVGVAARDKAGNPVVDLNAGTLTIDTTPPVAPTVQSQTTNIRRPTIRGTVSSDTVSLAITVNGQSGAATISGGQWSFVPPVNIPDGTYDVVATASDAAGNTRSDTTTNELVIDNVAPAAPLLERLATNERSPVLRGTATAGNTLSLTLNGTTYPLTAGTTWSLDLAAKGVVLADATYPVTVTATDPAGNSSLTIVADGLTIDTVDGLQVPTTLATLDWALVSDAANPVLRGSAPIGAAITGTIGALGVSTTADGSGHFTLTATAAGEGSVTVELNVAGGRTRWVSALTVDRTGAFTVPSGFPDVDGPRLTDLATPTVRGDALAGGSVAISINGGAATTVVADGSGRWARPAGTLVDGLYAVAAEDTHGHRTELTRALRIDTTTAFTVPTGHSTLELPVLTNNPRPTATGISPNGPVRISVDGGAFATTPVAGNGAWSRSLGLLADGTHRVTVITADGWITDRGRPLIDTVPPAVPTVQHLLTNDATPLLSGGSEPGTTLTVTVGGVTYVQGVDAALVVDALTGAWSLAVPSALTEGPYDVTVVSTDAAGNSSTNGGVSGRRDLIVDLTPPTVVANDELTNLTQPVLTGVAGDALSGVSDLQVVIRDNTNAVVGTFTLGVDPALTFDPQRGIWTLDLAVAGLTLSAAGNDYTITVTATDGAGNTASDAAVLRVDTTGPTVTVDRLLTRNQRPTLTGTVADATGIQDLTITVNGVAYTDAGPQLTLSGSATAKTWTLNLSGIATPLAEGTYDVSAVAHDTATNPGTDATANELTIDATAPVVTAANLRTSNRSPVLFGTCNDPTATLTVSVAGVGTFTAGDGHLALVGGVGPAWRLSLVGLTPVSEGAHAITVTATDAVSNVGTASATLTIDTTPPTAPTVTALASSNPAPVIGGTCDPTGTLTVTVAGRVFVQGVDAALVVTGGTWTLSLTTAGLTLADGLYDVVAESTDDLGNRAFDATTDELRIDTTPPAAPTVTALLTNSATPLLSGTSDPSGGLQITVAGHTYVAGVDAALQRSGSTWTLQLPATAEGTYDVVAVGTDDLGNHASDATSNELVIDRTPPRVPTVDHLTTASTTPVLTGTADPTAGLSVAVDGTLYVLGRDPQLTLAGDGTWRLDLGGTTALTSGTHQVQATSTDAAGNPATDATTGELLVDDQPPVVTVRTAIVAVPSPRVSGTARDALTSVTALHVTIAGHTLDWPGNPALTLTSGRWTLDLATAGIALADGVYDVTAVAVDTVGNTGIDPTSAELVVDTQAPVVSVDVLATTDTTPTISGACDDPTAVLFVRVNGITYASNDPASGLVLTGTRWQVTLPVTSDGVYDVEVAALDAAFNIGTDSSLDELTVDTVPPVVSVQSALTNVRSPVLHGTAVDALSGVTQLRVTVGGRTYVLGTDAALTIDAAGAWSLDLAVAGVALADATYPITVTAIDAAGNATSATGSLTVETQPPIITVDVLHTAERMPVITGTSDEQLSALSVTVAGVTYVSGSPGSPLTIDALTGRWTLVLPVALANGTYDVVAVGVDLAGNSGSDQTHDELVINAVAPLPLTRRFIIEGAVSANVIKVVIAGVYARPVDGRYRIEVPLPATVTELTIELSDSTGRVRTGHITVGPVPGANQ